MLRFALAGVFACALGGGGWTPVAVFALAAASDWVDGPLARRAGGSTTYGVLLDSGADIAFVLVALTAGVVAGSLSWIVPAAIACAATPYLVATVRKSHAIGRPARAFSAIGHAAGICNYALVGFLAGSVALPGSVWEHVLVPGSAVVVALNLGAVALRLRG